MDNKFDIAVKGKTYQVPYAGAQGLACAVEMTMGFLQTARAHLKARELKRQHRVISQPMASRFERLCDQFDSYASQFVDKALPLLSQGAPAFYWEAHRLPFPEKLKVIGELIERNGTSNSEHVQQINKAILDSLKR